MLRTIAVWAITGTILAGCGGGGGGDIGEQEETRNLALTDSNTCQPVSQLPDSHSKAIGIYEGAIVTNGGSASDAIALFGADGQFTAISPNGYASGSISGLPDTLIGPGYYTGTAGSFYLSLEGSFQPQQSLTLAVEDPLEFSMDLNYLTPPNDFCMETGNFASTYTDASDGSGPTISLTISETGHIDGSTTSGCIITGQIKSYGVVGGNFSAEFVTSNCPTSQDFLNGNYNGQGLFMFSETGIATDLVLMADSDTGLFSGFFSR